MSQKSPDNSALSPHHNISASLQHQLPEAQITQLLDFQRKMVLENRIEYDFGSDLGDAGIIILPQVDGTYVIQDARRRNLDHAEAGGVNGDQLPPNWLRVTTGVEIQAGETIVNVEDGTAHTHYDVILNGDGEKHKLSLKDLATLCANPDALFGLRKGKGKNGEQIFLLQFGDTVIIPDSTIEGAPGTIESLRILVEQLWTEIDRQATNIPETTHYALQGIRYALENNLIEVSRNSKNIEELLIYSKALQLFSEAYLNDLNNSKDSLPAELRQYIEYGLAVENLASSRTNQTGALMREALVGRNGARKARRKLKNNPTLASRIIGLPINIVEDDEGAEGSSGRRKRRRSKPEAQPPERNRKSSEDLAEEVGRRYENWVKEAREMRMMNRQIVFSNGEHILKEGEVVLIEEPDQNSPQKIILRPDNGKLSIYRPSEEPILQEIPSGQIVILKNGDTYSISHTSGVRVAGVQRFGTHNRVGKLIEGDIVELAPNDSDRPVYFKVLRFDESGQPSLAIASKEEFERLQNEWNKNLPTGIYTIESLNHPHLHPIYDLSKQNGAYYNAFKSFWKSHFGAKFGQPISFNQGSSLSPPMPRMPEPGKRYSVVNGESTVVNGESTVVNGESTFLGFIQGADGNIELVLQDDTGPNFLQWLSENYQSYKILREKDELAEYLRQTFPEETTALIELSELLGKTSTVMGISSLAIIFSFLAGVFFPHKEVIITGASISTFLVLTSVILSITHEHKTRNLKKRLKDK